MSDSFQDTRILEVYLEDLYGRLRQLRQTRPASGEQQRHYSRELLALSQTIRETAAQVRQHSEMVRSQSAQNMSA